MIDPHTYVEEVFDHIKKVPSFAKEYEIVPKRFRVEKVSKLGRWYLPFEEGTTNVFTGIGITKSFHGRVFFSPNSVQPGHSLKERFIEIKGYGQNGKEEINLWTRSDGDILNGMFYKNVLKEFTILDKANSSGLLVPIPLFAGKIFRVEWLRSGLRAINKFSRRKNKMNIEALISEDLDTIRREIKKHTDSVPAFLVEDPLSAYAQHYNAGVLGRAPLSPFRMGDPKDLYGHNNENTQIARLCGETFLGLLDLGYLHLCPSTGNWTQAGELTDMADCYDLKKDKNLEGVISERERKYQQDFWENLIGPFHTSNLSRFFIEGMFGYAISLKEAAEEVKSRTRKKIKKLTN